MSALFITIAAPLLAALLILLLRRGAVVLALAGVAIGWGASALLTLQVWNVGAQSISLPWLPNWPLTISATSTTALLATMVGTVSVFVLLFSVGYMAHETGRRRFYALMSLFIAAMQLLVLSHDWILLLGAWELIGFCSYALIGHWYGRDGVAAAASRAFLYTRGADLGLYVAVFLLIARTGSSDMAAALGLDPQGPAVGLLLLLAAAGKSAQVPLQGWLQRAMVGPTPVSSLLHSATLVAAGAILLIRAEPLFDPQALVAVALIGAATTVLAGLMALAADDLKQSLAASTSSQYGLMLMAVGAGYPAAALMHLVAHAAIKSSLFLEAGLLQKAYETTSLKVLAGAARHRPFLGLAFLISTLALAGVPPLSAMFSKDAILAAMLDAPHAGLYTGLALLGVTLSGAYAGRWLRILASRSGGRGTNHGWPWMAVGIAGLTVLAAVLGPSLEALMPAGLGPVPQAHVAFVAGLLAAAAGLAWGLLLARPLPGRLNAWAARGFAMGGGWKIVLGGPVMALARACDALDIRLHRAVTGFGRLALLFGSAVRHSDERGIDAAIAALVRGVRRSGQAARRLQSGLLHREMMWTAIGTGAALVLLAVISV